MNRKPIFSRESFSLCEVPVPEGYPQSQTHAGVAVNGDNYYLTTSPYPGPIYSLWVSRFRKLVRILTRGRLCASPSGEMYENPCLYLGEGGGNVPPSRFKLMQKSPLMETPEGFYGLPSYNSDPDIFIEEGIIHIMNRSIIRTKTYKDKPYDFLTRIYLMKGLDENGHFKLLSNQLVLEGQENYVSPSLVKFRGRYVVAFLDNHLVNRRVLFNNLFLSVSDNVEDAIIAKGRCPIKINASHLTPWHMSLFHHNDSMYAIVTCVEEGDTSLRMWQMLGEFNGNLREMTIYPTPLCDYNSYRGAAFVKEDGTFVFYSTTKWEKISGSKSVDGREIVVASCMFDDLLLRIKKEP